MKVAIIGHPLCFDTEMLARTVIERDISAIVIDEKQRGVSFIEKGSLSELASFNAKEVEQQLTVLNKDYSLSDDTYKDGRENRRERRKQQRKNKKQ